MTQMVTPGSPCYQLEFQLAVNRINGVGEAAGARDAAGGEEIKKTLEGGIEEDGE